MQGAESFWRAASERVRRVRSSFISERRRGGVAASPAPARRSAVRSEGAVITGGGRWAQRKGGCLSAEGAEPLFRCVPGPPSPQMAANSGRCGVGMGRREGGGEEKERAAFHSEGLCSHSVQREQQSLFSSDHPSIPSSSLHRAIPAALPLPSLPPSLHSSSPHLFIRPSLLFLLSSLHPTLY